MPLDASVPECTRRNFRHLRRSIGAIFLPPVMVRGELAVILPVLVAVFAELVTVAAKDVGVFGNFVVFFK